MSTIEVGKVYQDKADRQVKIVAILQGVDTNYCVIGVYTINGVDIPQFYTLDGIAKAHPNYLHIVHDLLLPSNKKYVAVYGDSIRSSMPCALLSRSGLYSGLEEIRESIKAREKWCEEASTTLLGVIQFDTDESYEKAFEFIPASMMFSLKE